jgi:hypothetical protein
MLWPPPGRMDRAASASPTAQPTKPRNSNLMRPTQSTRKMATTMPMTNNTAVPNNAPTDWNAKALNTSRPRTDAGVLSEMTMCAVG